MNTADRRARLAVDTTLAAALDHVRLSYHYLDAGDIDGYSSLFEEEVVLKVPGFPPMQGRAALERYGSTVRHRHAVHDVFGSDRRLAVVGRLDDPSGAGSTDFVDVFAVSDRALLVARRCYYHTPPPWQVPRVGG